MQVPDSPPPKDAPADDSSNPLRQRGMVVLLACTAGLAVANLYYNQPLLPAMARELGVGPAEIASVTSLTQLGYGLGILTIAPLGDQLERRRMMIVLLALVACCLAGIATATQLWTLGLFSLLMGMNCVLAHVILPYVGQLAPPAQRGKLVGQVMSGVLLGIILARTVSGMVGSWLGWRAVFWMGAANSVCLAVVLASALPPSRGTGRIGYFQILTSMGRLFWTVPGLREAAFTGAAMFGCFSCFWSTLAFRLADAPYHLGAREAGLFGLIGALGALAAPLVGQLADKRGPRFVIGVAFALCAVAFAILGVWDASMVGLVTGVIVLDLGVQAAMISNQARIYGLVPGSESRLNAVYMVGYFTGGALGSKAAAYGWSHARWPGVVAAGLAFVVAGTVAHVAGAVRSPARTQ